MEQEDTARPAGTGSHASTEPNGLGPTGFDPSRETILGGLLGASCTREEFDLCGIELLKMRRMAEIEHRILAIESELGFLNPGGQYGGVPFHPLRDSGRHPKDENGAAG